MEYKDIENAICEGLEGEELRLTQNILEDLGAYSSITKDFEIDYLAKSITELIYYYQNQGGFTPMWSLKDWSSHYTSPDYYNKGGIECIDAQEYVVSGLSGFEGYIVGNIIKYLWRYRRKDGMIDLRKALTYAEKLKEYHKPTYDATKTVPYYDKAANEVQ
jgi:hypothetical protein